MTEADALPTEARIERTQSGWSIHLPLRREDVSLDKRTVVGEEVVVRRAREADVQRVQADIRREVPRVERFDKARHDLDATQPLEPTHPHDTLAGSGMEQDPLG